MTVNLFINFSEEVSNQVCWQQLLWIWGKSLVENNVLKMYFLYSNALPEIPPLLSNQAGKEQFSTFGWGQSRTVSASENFFKLYFLKPVQTGLGVSMWVCLASEWKIWGLSPVLPSLYLKKTPLRLELSGCLSCSQIYLDSSTNEIKLPLYQGLVCEEQNIIPFIASHALSLILTS